MLDMTGIAQVVAAGIVAAETPVPDPTQTPRYVDPSVVSPGLIGFVIFVGLGLATVLLWLSMNRQLKKVHFDDGSGQTRLRNGPPTLPVAEDPPAGPGRADPARDGDPPGTPRSESD